MGRHVWAATVMALAACCASGQVPVTRCKHVSGASVVVDGRLSESAWATADSVTLRDVVTGGVPSWKTTVKVLWDSGNLYLGFRSLDARVRNTLSGHDQSLYQQDVVEAFIDPDGDGLYYYELEWNCLNAVFDLMMASAPSEPLPSGETVRNHLEWTASAMRNAVTVQGSANNDVDVDTGMTVEVAIAWSDFSHSAQPLPPRPGDTLRIGFFRIEYAQTGTEYTAWSPTGQVQFHLPQTFGKLVFEGQISGARTTPVRGPERVVPPETGGGPAMDLQGRTVAPSRAGVVCSPRSMSVWSPQ